MDTPQASQPQIGQSRKKSYGAWIWFIVLTLLCLASLYLWVASPGESQISDAEMLSLREGRQPSTAASASDADLQELKQCLASINDKWNEAHAKYLQEVKAINWPSVLDPKRLKNDPTLSQARLMISRMREAIKNNKSRKLLIIENARRQIGSLNISESDKSSVIHGFDTGIADGLDRWKILDLELQSVDKVESIVQMLSTSKAWTIDKNEIVFANDKDLAVFSTCFDEIDQIKRQQDQLQQKLDKLVQQDKENSKTNAQGK